MPTVSSPFYTDDHHAYREVVRQFTEKEIAPNVHEWDLAGEVPRDLYVKAGAIGLFGDGFDEEHGGHGQRDAIMRLVLMEELCRAGSGGVVAALFSNYIGLPPIQRFAAANPPLSSIETMPPKPTNCRAASAWCGCEASPG